MGRIKYVTDNTTDNQLINFLIQGTASDGFKRAMVDIDQKIVEYGARIVHTQHDEVIVEAPEEVIEITKNIVKESMENAFSEMLPGVPMAVDIKVTDSWGGDEIDTDDFKSDDEFIDEVNSVISSLIECVSKRNYQGALI